MTKLAAYIGLPDIYDSATQSAATTQWNSFVNAMGQSPTMMLTYVDKTHPISQWVSDQQWNVASWKATPWLAGVTPIVGLPMAVVGDNGDVDFKAIASGAWDSVINGVFKDWVSAGYTNLYLRPGWEMNGDWYPWAVTNANAADFVAAFRHIADLAHNYQGASITVVWNPNVGDPANANVPISNYYPGDSYVDVIAIDTYGAPLDSDNSPSNQATDSADYTLNAAIAFAKAHGKPFALAETGANDAVFPANLAKAVAAANVNVDFVGFWDINDGGLPLTWSQNATDSAAWRAAYKTIDQASTAAAGGVTTPPAGGQTSGGQTSGGQSAGGQTNALVIRVSENSFRGDAAFRISIDGQVVSASQSVTASHAAGSSQQFSFSGSWGTGPHTISITYLNDKSGTGGDRNLYVDSIAYDGVKATSSAALYSAGTVNYLVKQDGVFSAVSVGSNNAVTTATGTKNVVNLSSDASVFANGQDVVNAGTGSETITASVGAITVNGSSGRLRFFGGSGNATLNLTSGQTSATLRSGNTVVNMGGSVTIAEGTGVDLYNFHYGVNPGTSSISGFRVGTDHLHLTGYPANAASISNRSGGTVVSLSDGNRITLSGVHATAASQLFS